MGSLPREKAGVGSAVNDTTRQMGGALGVAIIGSVVVERLLRRHQRRRRPVRRSPAQTLGEPEGSLGGALEVGPAARRPAPAAFVERVKDSFVDGLRTGLRLGAVIVLVAAFVAWQVPPGLRHDPLAHPTSRRRAADGDAVVRPGRRAS